MAPIDDLTVISSVVNQLYGSDDELPVKWDSQARSFLRKPLTEAKGSPIKKAIEKSSGRLDRSDW